jgi:ribosomal-protein-alanine N-acetyltransferase
MPIPVLETERLRLRPFSAEDDVAVFALASDPDVARFVRFEAHRSIEETRAFLEMVERHYAEGNAFAWAVVLCENGELIGSCGFPHRSPERNSAEIGYWLGRPYWGQGYAVEAAYAMIRFGFEQAGLERIEAKCFVTNHAGQRVIEKLGLALEGTESSEMIKGGYPELRLYGISREEWRARGGASDLRG